MRWQGEIAAFRSGATDETGISNNEESITRKEIDSTFLKNGGSAHLNTWGDKSRTHKCIYLTNPLMGEERLQLTVENGPSAELSVPCKVVDGGA